MTQRPTSRTHLHEPPTSRRTSGATGRMLGRRGAAVGVSVLLLTTTACGTSGSGGDAADRSSTTAAAMTLDGDVALFDADVVHDIDVSFDQDAFDMMLATYESSGDKEWIEATVTIDGTTYEQAGLRLKGNSSLRGASRSAAEDLPWLIRLDKYVDGQTHQDYEDIVVRSNNSSTALNEAVALDLLNDAGLAAVQAAPSRFSANGSADKLRLIVEHPDDDEWYESEFDGLGALYKSESTGDWSYRGDDPESYTELFDQEGGKDVADLTPLIELLQFLDEADDETFAAELPERLDVDAFATYLAMMDLVDNFDDIDGPGNNSYLWWDAETEQFTIVPWDLNLAFGGMGGGGFPGGGGGGFPGGGRRPGGSTAGGSTDDGSTTDGSMSTRPEGMPDLPEGEIPQFPADGEMPQFPEGEIPEFPADGEMPSFPGGGGGRGPGGGFGRSNPLVERFHANEALEALYQEKLETLEAELFDSGTAAQHLASRTEVLLDQATDLVDEATIRSESEAVAAAFE